MPKSTSLENVRALAEELRQARVQAKKNSYAWIEEQIAPQRLNLELAVMHALDSDETITDTARAYSDRIDTPNRNAIYDIKAKYTEHTQDLLPEAEYPFFYTARRTNNGRRVHDIGAYVENFGPEKITGNYHWTTAGGDIRPVLDPDNDPWPYHAWYKAVLDRWVATHPVPTE